MSNLSKELEEVTDWDKHFYCPSRDQFNLDQNRPTKNLRYMTDLEIRIAIVIRKRRTYQAFAVGILRSSKSDEFPKELLGFDHQTGSLAVVLQEIFGYDYPGQTCIVGPGWMVHAVQ